MSYLAKKKHKLSINSSSLNGTYKNHTLAGYIPNIRHVLTQISLHDQLNATISNPTHISSEQTLESVVLANRTDKQCTNSRLQGHVKRSGIRNVEQILMKSIISNDSNKSHCTVCGSATTGQRGLKQSKVGAKNNLNQNQSEPTIDISTILKQHTCSFPPFD